MLKDQKEQTETARDGQGQKLIRNTLFNFLGQFYILALGIAVVPYVVHRLGAGLYGVVVLVATIGGFGSMLSLGIGNALGKFVSEYHWRNELRTIRTLFRTGFTTALLGGIAGALLLIVFRDPISRWLFHDDSTVGRYLNCALWVTAFGLLTAPPIEALSAIITGLQRFDLINRVNVFVASVRNFGMILVLIMGLYLKSILIVLGISGIANLLGCLYYARQLMPGLRLAPQLDMKCLKQLVGYSAFVLLAGVSALAVHRFDRVLVAYFLPISAVSFYAVPYSLAEKTGSAVGNVTSVIFPSASELAARQAEEKLQRLYIYATKITLLVALPVTAVLMAYPGPILRSWVGTEFAVRGASTLRLLSGGFLLNILGHVPYVVTQGIGRPWLSAKFSILNGIGNVMLLIVLIPIWGIRGAGAGFLLAEALIIPAFVHEANRILKVPWRLLMFRSYLFPLISGTMTFLVLWLFRDFVTSPWKLAACCGLGFAVYAASVLAMTLDSRERMEIYRQLANIFGLRRSVASV